MNVLRALRAVDASGRRLDEDGSQRMTESLDPEAAVCPTAVRRLAKGQPAAR